MNAASSVAADDGRRCFVQWMHSACTVPRAPALVSLLQLNCLHRLDQFQPKFGGYAGR
jgi:hypothetical protein